MVSAVRSSRSCRVLRNAPYVDNNCVENGVMLRGDLHKMFDRFFWSVHPTTRVVVVFVPIPELMAYHGMKVARTPQGFPQGKIWQWHWEQCVIRCMRAAAEGNPEDKYYDNEPAAETIAIVTHQMADLDITGPTCGSPGLSVVAHSDSINGGMIDKPDMDGTQVLDLVVCYEDTDMVGPPAAATTRGTDEDKATNSADSSDTDSTASSRPASPADEASP
ncbi:hypothetical protein FN846DRAFT_910622 [Sphaerosporella brunnea]|uniref:HNH nuclease domain-containing protein n=1 Tax=Sphaerosporella brunnea TaxID=1250544 RepID=A0A5J5EMN7_9PEZI|nr:hypothetical protein FN846DRAFT_910622 [Sphaerosporella brunnea]